MKTVLLFTVIQLINFLSTISGAERQSPLIIEDYFEKHPAQNKEQPTFAIGPIPDWVKVREFSKDLVVVKSSQVEQQKLLIDRQLNIEEKTRYEHRAVKILSQNGAQRCPIEILFNPTYETVVVHSINVIRDGRSFSRLEEYQYEFMQKKEKLGKSSHQTWSTLIYFPYDVRIGDIMEYSFSIVTKEDRVESLRYDSFFFFQDNSTFFEKVCLRVLIHPNRFFSSRAFFTNIEPHIADLSPSLREFSWKILGSNPCFLEKETPTWYWPFACVQISRYQSWEEVVEKLLALYTLSDQFLHSPCSDLLHLVEKWEESTCDPAERSLLALRFVQDEIHYIPFDVGIEPTDPLRVFERRFGVCKDKALLLHALLTLMGIDSTPVLVNSRFGKELPLLLPAPGVFDHVVLQIVLDEKIYFVDPTVTQQGGCLQDNFFPDYGFGLVLARETTALTPLPQAVLDKPMEIATSILMTSLDTAHVTIKRTFHGYSAEQMRKSLEKKGITNFSEEYFKDVQKKYQEASMISPLTVSDDRKKNILTTLELYQIATRSHEGERFFEPSSIILGNYLDQGITSIRTTPFALAYPFWVKECIHVENPFSRATGCSKSLTYKHESFEYAYRMEAEGQNNDFYFELKHTKDHVPPISAREYWNITCEMNLKPSCVVKIQ